MSHIVKCDNIAIELEAFAKKESITLDECDFKLLGLSSYIQSIETKHAVKLDEIYKKEYASREKIINEHATFNQIYKIDIFKKSAIAFKLDYEIRYTQYNAKAVLRLYPESKFALKKYKPKEMFVLLNSELNKIKAQNRILVNLFSTQLKEDLKTFIKLLYANKFTEAFDITLCKTFPIKTSKEPELIEHYLLNKDEHQEFSEVEADDLILEFKKPIFGESGLSVFGKSMQAEYINNLDLLDFNYDQASIKVVESEQTIEFQAAKKGYVKFERNTYSVENKIELKQFNRNQNALTADESNEVEVIVAQKNVDMDTISEGAQIKSEYVHVTGYVGRNARIESKELIIDGTTHNGSNLYAKNAKINRHKGFIRCSSADINILEGGEVHASNATITTAQSGTVYAQNVHIKQVRNNLKVYASNSITIDVLSGEDNSFEINYKKIPILVKRMEFIDEDIELLKYSYEKAERHDITRAKSIQEKIRNFRQEIEDIKHSACSASIEIKSEVKGINKIIFHVNAKELSYATEAKEYTPFHLKCEDDRITLLPVNISLELE